MITAMSAYQNCKARTACIYILWFKLISVLWLKDLNKWHDAIKLLEGITGKTFSDINYTSVFLRPITHGNKDKNKNKQMGLNQTYKLLHSKGNQTKGQPTEWEKIFANDANDKGLISKIFKQLIQLNKNIKQPNQKMGRRSK